MTEQPPLADTPKRPQSAAAPLILSVASLVASIGPCILVVLFSAAFAAAGGRTPDGPAILIGVLMAFGPLLGLVLAVVALVLARRRRSNVILPVVALITSIVLILVVVAQLILYLTM